MTAFEMRASSSGDFLSRSRTISPLYSLSLSYRRPPVKRAEKVTEGSSPFYGISGCDVIGSDMLSDVKSHVCQFFIVADEVGHFFVGYFGAGRLFFVLII